MPPLSVRETVWINTGPERVWDLCDYLDDWSAWGPPIQAARWGRSSGWVPGHRFELTADHGFWPLRLPSFRIRGQVLRVVPRRELWWRGRLLALRGDFGLVLEPLGKGTRVDFRSSFEGLGARVAGAPFVARRLAGLQRGFLGALRRAAERVVGQIA